MLTTFCRTDNEKEKIDRVTDTPLSLRIIPQKMRIARSINAVGCHCADEVCDVIVGDVLNPSGCSTMYE